MVLVDLFCGRGGWSLPALQRGWRCVGFDLADLGYCGELHRCRLPVPDAAILAHKPDLVVASPPCDDFARAALPWLRTVRDPDVWLLCWSIGLAARLPCPVVVECSRLAGQCVPPARICGPYALWGCLPALLPDVRGFKSRMTSARRVERAMIAPDLAGFIVEWAERRAARSPAA